MCRRVANLLAALALLPVSQAIRSNDLSVDEGDAEDDVFSLSEEAGASDEDEETQQAQCHRIVAEPAGGASLQGYFDGLRQASQPVPLLSASAEFGGAGDPETCTKKDVCLLMRQLDMDFYSRARAGTLTDSDYDQPPPRSWLRTGNCAKQNRGYRMVPVFDEWLCRNSLKGAETLKDPTLTTTNDPSLPAGCVVHDGKAYLNEADSTTTAGTAHLGNGMDRNSRLVYTLQLCEMDRTLSESAAAYYSPYKLKRSMVHRPAHSTACSFGMMAFLSKLRETKSSCAKILTYRPHSEFYSAQDALDKAAQLQAANKTEEADTIRQYVDTVRQKFVLIEKIAKEWCPDTWTTALATPGGTCDAPRLMSWTAEGAELSKAASSAKGTAGRGGGRRGGGRRGGRRGGRLGHAQQQAGETWSTVGNSELLAKVTKAILEAAKEEDSRADGEEVRLKSAMDPDGGAGPASDGTGRPPKYALTEAACDAFEDISLASVLADVPEVPPDFFRDASIPED